jgi:4,5-dihydroxyphthalate decarboxylase
VPPPGVTVREVPAGKSLASMLLSGELDAAFVRRARAKQRSHMIERSSRVATDDDWSVIHPLFKDNFAEGRRFFSERGYLPINHTYVIRGDVHRQHPWLAFNLYKAFVEAKDHVEARLIDEIPLSLIFRYDYLEMTQDIFGPDPFPYGIAANTTALETLVSYSFEQGLIPQVLPLGELFAESTLDLGSDATAG